MIIILHITIPTIRPVEDLFLLLLYENDLYDLSLLLPTLEILPNFLYSSYSSLLRSFTPSILRLSIANEPY